MQQTWWGYDVIPKCKPLEGASVVSYHGIVMKRPGSLAAEQGRFIH